MRHSSVPPLVLATVDGYSKTRLWRGKYGEPREHLGVAMNLWRHVQPSQRTEKGNLNLSPVKPF